MVRHHLPKLARNGNLFPIGTNPAHVSYPTFQTFVFSFFCIGRLLFGCRRLGPTGFLSSLARLAIVFHHSERVGAPRPSGLAVAQTPASKDVRDVSLLLDGGGGNRAGHHQGQIHTFQRVAGSDGWPDALSSLKEKEQRRRRNFLFNESVGAERALVLVYYLEINGSARI